MVYLSIPPKRSVILKNRMGSEVRNCQNCKNRFTIEPDDFGFYEKMKVPPPTWCPRCRLIRRLSWQGYRILYKKKCDFTGEMLITTHHPDSPYKIYRQDVWWSDKWDPKEYGRDYDFSRSFFEQFAELKEDVPVPALYTDYAGMLNSEYCNAASSLKNCYLAFRITGGESSAYVNQIVDIKDSLDVSFANFCELSYDSEKIDNCYKAFYSQDCNDCNDVWFSRDLTGCQNCIGCINLRNKNYHIFNKPYSKDEYEDFKSKFDLGSWKEIQEFKEKTEAFILKYPRREFHGRKNQNVSGEYIVNSKNVHDCYMVANAEDVRYCYLLKNGPAAKSYDWSVFGDNGEWIYDSCWTGLNASNNKFGIWNYYAHDVEYCFGCHSSGNLFGCAGIRKGEYCILNKQYGKAEYKEMVERIKKQMMDMPYRDKLGREYRYGEYFPPELAIWTYNESTAYEWFPLSKEEALRQGFAWREDDEREYKDATVDIPDHIRDVKDGILKEILKCGACGKNYRLIEMELDFYRKFQVPVPRQCPLCRDRGRIKRLNPMAEIFERKCAKCERNIRSPYSPDRPEIVYCEQCYQAEVV